MHFPTGSTTRAVPSQSRRETTGLFRWQKVKRQSLFLEAMGPEIADLRDAGVHVAGLVLHAQLAGFQYAVSQEILDEVLQALSAAAHIVQNFTLAFVQTPQLFALQQFDVARHDR